MATTVMPYIVKYERATTLNPIPFISLGWSTRPLEESGMRALCASMLGFACHARFCTLYTLDLLQSVAGVHAHEDITDIHAYYTHNSH